MLSLVRTEKTMSTRTLVPVLFLLVGVAVGWVLNTPSKAKQQTTPTITLKADDTITISQHGSAQSIELRPITFKSGDYRHTFGPPVSVERAWMVGVGDDTLIACERIN